jgi:hypothetical protein
MSLTTMTSRSRLLLSGTHKIVRSVHIDKNQQEDKYKLTSVKIVETLGALGFFVESAIS